MSKFILFTKPECRYCTKAKELLHDTDSEFVEFNIIDKPEFRNFLLAYGATTVPQVFWTDGIEPTYVGGYDDLVHHFGEF